MSRISVNKHICNIFVRIVASVSAAKEKQKLLGICCIISVLAMAVMHHLKRNFFLNGAYD